MPIISNFPMGGNTDEIEQLIGEHNKSAEAHKEQFDKQKEYTDAARTITRTVTLTAAGWTDKAQTVTCEGVAADEAKQQIIVMPASKDESVWSAAAVRCVSQGENSLNFTCSIVPTEDISVYVNITQTAYQLDVTWDTSKEYPFGDITPAEMRAKIEAASADDLSVHIADKSNPHGVTKEQLGAASAEDLTVHTGNQNNPHGVTAAQIGAALAEDLTAHTNDKSNPHGVTASQVQAMPLVPVYLAKTDDVLKLAPGRYRYEGSDDEQTTTMNLPIKSWHWEITVIGQFNVEGVTSNYKIITAENFVGEIYRNILTWDTWSGWTKILSVDTSGNAQISSDFILPHGLTTRGWCNFEQIRISNSGNPFECSQYIDFHAVGSDVDYTTRIYADKAGVLRMAEAVPAGDVSIRPSVFVPSEQTPGTEGFVFWQYN